MRRSGVEWNAAFMRIYAAERRARRNLSCAPRSHPGHFRVDLDAPGCMIAGILGDRIWSSPMSRTRREFIASCAATLAGSTLLPRALYAAEPPARASKGLRILILGGTGFLGPACTESALARGHSVTQFNSGRTEERRREAGRPSVVPSGVQQLYGNRDPNKTADDRKTEGKADAPRDPNSPKG